MPVRSASSVPCLPSRKLLEDENDRLESPSMPALAQYMLC